MAILQIASASAAAQRQVGMEPPVFNRKASLIKAAINILLECQQRFVFATNPKPEHAGSAEMRKGSQHGWLQLKWRVFLCSRPDSLADGR